MSFHPLRNRLRDTAKNAAMEAGYSTEQADRIVGQIGDGTLLKLFLEHLPDILAFIAAVLPLFAAKEPPANTP